MSIGGIVFTHAHILTFPFLHLPLLYLQAPNAAKFPQWDLMLHLWSEFDCLWG